MNLIKWPLSTGLWQLRALRHFKIISFSLELKFKTEPPILSDQALNFAFTKFTKWRFMQIIFLHIS